METKNKMPTDDEREDNNVICMETFHLTTENEVAQTLKARDYKDPLCVLV